MMKLFAIRESDKDIHERLMKLTNEEDKNTIQTMDAQVALNELSRHLLGDDWYIVEPMCNSQANPIIIEEIERRYRNKRKRYRLNITWKTK